MYLLKDKTIYQQHFDGSSELFEACWVDYINHLAGAIDDPKEDQDVMNWLDNIAAEKVNDSSSEFYIHG